MTAALAFITKASAILVAGVNTLEAASKIGGMIQNVLATGNPTDEMWDNLKAFEDEQRARLNAPMEGEN